MKIAVPLLFVIITHFFAADGQKVYTSYGCYGCHGIDAKGNGDYPSLASKSYDYLLTRLNGYKNGTINSYRADMMKPFAKSLSDEEIKAVAEYLSTLKESPKRYYEEYDLSDAM